MPEGFWTQTSILLNQITRLNSGLARYRVFRLDFHLNLNLALIFILFILQSCQQD